MLLAIIFPGALAAGSLILGGLLAAEIFAGNV